MLGLDTQVLLHHWRVGGSHFLPLRELNTPMMWRGFFKESLRLKGSDKRDSETKTRLILPSYLHVSVAGLGIGGGVNQRQLQGQ